MQENKKLKDASTSGIIYRFFERLLAHLVNLIVSIVLARILMPEDYGIISLINVFITICNVFVTDGLSSGLIQKKDPDELDFSSIFWVSILLSILLYFVIFFCAPFIADFYENELIRPVLRVVALRIPIAAFSSVQGAYVSKKLLFKKFFWSTLTGTIVSGIVGVIMALLGFGVWALVAQLLLNPFIDTIFLFIFVGWRPHFKFSFKRFKNIFSFGWKVLVSGLIADVYEELRSLIIAKKYSSADLAFYSKGNQFPSILGNNVSTAISSVMFPVFSEAQNDKVLLKKMVRRSMSLATYILCPLLIGFASVAESFVSIVLTDKWLPAVPYMYIFCLFYIFKPIKNINKSSIKALKKSGLDLMINIVEKVIGIALIFAFLWSGPFYLALGALITYVVASIMNIVANSILLKYTVFEQLKDIVPSFLLALISCAPSFFFKYLRWNVYLTLVIQVLVPVIIFVGISYIFKIEQFNYILNMIKEKFLKKKKAQKS